MRRALLPTALASLAFGCADDPPPASPGVAITAPDARAHIVSAPRAADCGAPNVAARWAFEWSGDRLVGATHHEPADTLTQTHTWTYDAAGRLTTWRRDGASPVVFEFDRDPDGRITAWRRLEGDQRFSLTVIRTPEAITLRGRGLLYLDLNDGAHPDFDYATDVPGWAEVAPRIDDLLVLLLARHAGDDGALHSALAEADFVERRALDDLGRVVQIRLDVDADGEAEWVEDRAYTDDGVTRSVDADGDGAPDVQVMQRVDEQGRVVETVQRGADGAAQHIVRVTFEPGLQRTTRDTDGDGTADEITWLYLNAAGHRIAKYEDVDADSLAEWRKKYYYDADTGLRVFDARDNNVDGRVDERVDYTYDAEGHLVDERRGRPDDGHCDAAF